MHTSHLNACDRLSGAGSVFTGSYFNMGGKNISKDKKSEEDNGRRYFQYSVEDDISQLLFHSHNKCLNVLSIIYHSCYQSKWKCILFGKADAMRDQGH